MNIRIKNTVAAGKGVIWYAGRQIWYDQRRRPYGYAPPGQEYDVWAAEKQHDQMLFDQGTVQDTENLCLWVYRGTKTCRLPERAFLLTGILPVQKPVLYFWSSQSLSPETSISFRGYSHWQKKDPDCNIAVRERRGIKIILKKLASS